MLSPEKYYFALSKYFSSVRAEAGFRPILVAFKLGREEGVGRRVWSAAPVSHSFPKLLLSAPVVVLKYILNYLTFSMSKSRNSCLSPCVWAGLTCSKQNLQEVMVGDFPG